MAIFTINHHHYFHEGNKNVSQKLDFIIQKLELFMATSQEQFDTLMARLNTVTNDIAEDYQTLLTEIQNGTVSQASLDAAAANIAQLEALGASVGNPVPEPPTEPTEPPAEPEA